MTFFSNLGVTVILCSFRLILEGNGGKEIHQPSRLEFLEKFSANNFVLSDAKKQHFRATIYRRYSRFISWEHYYCSNFPKVMWGQVMLHWRIHTSIPTWAHSQNAVAPPRSIEFKDKLLWNISKVIMEQWSSG